MATPSLLTPLRIRGVELRNRVMITPMCQYSAGIDGRATDWHLAHYGRFALGGAGIIMLEATAVCPEGRLSYGDLGLWSDEQIPDLARISALIVAQGTIPAIQLGHSGRKACTQRPWHGNGPLTAEDLLLRNEAQWQTVSVTDEPAGPGFPAPHQLTPLEVSSMVEAWAAAARRALVAGFLALEIHGAHGYLIHSFLSPLTNKRDDQYGGDFPRRMRFALDVARAVRAVWPAHLPLFFRISSVDADANGWTLANSIELARELKGCGVDLVDCSSGGIGADYSIAPRGPGFQVPYSERIKREAGIMTAAVGLITGAQQAEEIVASGRADLVAIGREALFDPNWAVHAASELEPANRFAAWPDQSGWWLSRRRTPRV